MFLIILLITKFEIRLFSIMKILKVIIVGILGIMALMMIISVFIPSLVVMERSIVIKAPKEFIFQQVNDFRNWNNWSPWMLSDSTMVIKLEESRGGEGSVFLNWENSNSKGTISISKSVPFELIETIIERDNFSPVRGTHKFEELSDGVRVHWNMQTDMGKSPYRKYKGFFLDNMIGSKMEKGLQNLKYYTENNVGTAVLK